MDSPWSENRSDPVALNVECLESRSRQTSDNKREDGFDKKRIGCSGDFRVDALHRGAGDFRRAREEIVSEPEASRQPVQPAEKPMEQPAVDKE